MNYFYLILIVSSLLANNQIPGLDQKRPILLKGGILHTVSGDVLEGYDLLFSKGKIIKLRFDEKNIDEIPIVATIVTA